MIEKVVFTLVFLKVCVIVTPSHAEVALVGHVFTTVFPGIDKMLKWEEVRGKVEFSSTIVSSTITFWLSGQISGQVGGQVSGQVLKLINTILDGVYSISEIQEKCGIK